MFLHLKDSSTSPSKISCNVVGWEFKLISISGLLIEGILTLIFLLTSTLGPFTSIPGTLTSISDCSIFIFPFASGILTPGSFLV